MTVEPTRLNFETPTKPSEVLASKQLEQIEADKVIDNFVEIMKNHDFKGCNDNTCKPCVAGNTAYTLGRQQQYDLMAADLKKRGLME